MSEKQSKNSEVGNKPTVRIEKHVEAESVDDVFEKEDLKKINLKDLFLLQLPDNGPVTVYYSSGNLAISQTSNGYVAIFENVSLILDCTRLDSGHYCSIIQAESRFKLNFRALVGN